MVTQTRLLGLKSLVDSTEIAEAYSLLARKLIGGAKAFRHMVGWHGGHRNVMVHWHERLGFWVVMNPRLNASHFWIGFGLQNPRRHKILAITCEINPSKRGTDRRSAGILVKNQAGNYLLGHSGKAGGGRPGIGKQAFLEHYQGKLRRVLWRNGKKTVQSDAVVVGEIANRDFLENLSRFIVAVDSFKQGVKKNLPDLDALLGRQQKRAESEGKFDPENLQDSRKRLLASIVVRRGQTDFRRKLLKEYAGRCAISGCDCPDALEAAHIRPYWGVETNHVTNGLLLRGDLHTLFDLQKLGVTHDYTVVISKDLVGTVYGKLQGTKLQLPRNTKARPSLKVLAMHRAEMKVRS